MLIWALLFLLGALVITTIICILNAHKKEIWEKVIFKDEGRKRKKH